MICQPTTAFYRSPASEPSLLTCSIFACICQIAVWGQSTSRNSNVEGSAFGDIPMRERSCTSFIQGSYLNTRGHAPYAHGEDVKIPGPPTLSGIPASSSRAAIKHDEPEHLDGILQEQAVGVFANGRDDVWPSATLHTTVAKVDGPLPKAQSVKLPFESPVGIKTLPSLKSLIATVRNATSQESWLQRYVQLHHMGSTRTRSSIALFIVAVCLGIITLVATILGCITGGSAPTKPKEDPSGEFGRHFPWPEPAIPVDLTRACRPISPERGGPALQRARSTPGEALPIDTARTLPCCGSSQSLQPSPRPLTDHVTRDPDLGRTPRTYLDAEQGSSGDHLAPWMVVPSTAMVELLVPRVILNADLDLCTTLHVDDINGVPMFLASFVASDALGPGGRDLKLVVTNPVNMAVHAWCRLTQARNSLVIYRSSGTPFGKLSPTHQNDGSYIVRTLRFGEVVFTKESGSDMCIVDDEHRELGIVGTWNQEDSAVLRKAMLVGPNADAVLIVLCLLGIDWLDFELGRHRGAQ